MSRPSLIRRALVNGHTFLPDSINYLTANTSVLAPFKGGFSLEHTATAIVLLGLPIAGQTGLAGIDRLGNFGGHYLTVAAHSLASIFCHSLARGRVPFFPLLSAPESRHQPPRQYRNGPQKRNEAGDCAFLTGFVRGGAIACS
jgi:hypothetical protein